MAVGELLAQVTARLPGGGEERSGQLAMAEAVATAIEEEAHLAIRAGTGTGKSLAYLVPAIASRKKIVVATATRALQDQLAGKDLPFLAETLGMDFSFSILKGRSNYLCRQKLEEVAGAADPHDSPAARQSQMSFDGVGDEDPGEPPSRRFVDDLRRLVSWARRTKSGDVAELDWEPDPRAWSALSTGARECPGASNCPSGGSCLAERARWKATESDVIVTNTHLYAAHLASDGGVLPDHQVVVFDEAHQLEDVASQALGIELSGGNLRSLARQVRPLLGTESALAEAVADAGDLLEAAAARAPSGPMLGTASEGLSESLAIVRGRLLEMTTALGATEAESSTKSTARDRALQAASSLAGDLSRLSALHDEDVVWVEGADRTPIVKLAPVEVAPILAEKLWPRVSAILTSATLPVGLVTRLGLPPEVVDVGSPFPYRENSILYCAAHLPRPGARDASDASRREESLHEELAALIEASSGRAFALFTSWNAMSKAHDALADRLSYRCFVQGELPKHELLRRFTEDESSCLFATMSFWQGVDVPGEALSLVVIDRIPFPRPDDPLIAARRAKAGDAAFHLVDIPRAATLLAQGAGRLIRSSTDRGVVAVLDSRLATAGYRKLLLEALPPMRRSVHLDEVRDFFARPTG